MYEALTLFFGYFVTFISIVLGLLTASIGIRYILKLIKA